MKIIHKFHHGLLFALIISLSGCNYRPIINNAKQVKPAYDFIIKWSDDIIKWSDDAVNIITKRQNYSLFLKRLKICEMDCSEIVKALKSLDLDYNILKDATPLTENCWTIPITKELPKLKDINVIIPGKLIMFKKPKIMKDREAAYAIMDEILVLIPKNLNKKMKPASTMKNIFIAKCKKMSGKDFQKRFKSFSQELANKDIKDYYAIE